MILRQITTSISVSDLFCLQFAFAPVQNSKNTRQITTAQILSYTYLIALDQVSNHQRCRQKIELCLHLN